MTIPPGANSPPIRAEPPCIPLSISGLNPIERLEKAVCVNADCGKSSWDRLHRYFINNGIINNAGEWILAEPPELPKLGKGQFERLGIILKKPYELVVGADSIEPLKATLSLGKLLQGLEYPEVELIGSGVDWVLGEEYFKQFLQSLKVPDELIVDDLFDEMRRMPQDFDFRFFAADANPDQMQRVTDPLFIQLSSILNAPMNDVKKACSKKWASKPADIDKLGMVSLELYSVESPGAKAFDIDFIFYHSLQRHHLNKRDALSLKVQIPPPRGDASPPGARTAVNFELNTDLKDVREALAHYITRLIDADNPETVNHTGLPINLAGTTKGRFPLKARLLSRMYSQLKEKSLLPLDLIKVIATHCKGQPHAILAAAFNAGALLHHDRWTDMLAVISKQHHAGSTLLESIYQAATADGGSFAAMQDLLTAHAFLGWGDAAVMFEKQERGFFELWCKEEGNAPPLSIYVKTGLGKALRNLSKSAAWKSFDTLSLDWLTKASFDGPPLPGDSLKAITDLLSSEAPAARNLAFVLLMKWHRQHPDDSHIITLLRAFTTMIQETPPETLPHFAAMLTETLSGWSGTFAPESMHMLQGGVEALSESGRLTAPEFAAAIYKIDDARLGRFALKLLTEEIATEESASLAMELIGADIETHPERAAPLLFEFGVKQRVNASESLQLFQRLLQSDRWEASSPECSAAAAKFAGAMDTKESRAANPGLLAAIEESLKSRFPEAAKAIYKGLPPSSKKSRPGDGRPTEQLKDLIQRGNDLSRSRTQFTQLVHAAGGEDDLAGLREIFDLLVAKLEPKLTKDLNPALSLVLSKDASILFKNDPSTLLAHYTRLFPTLTSSQTALKIQACTAAAALLAGLECSAPNYLLAASQLASTLDTLDSRRNLITPAVKDQLAASLKIIAPSLHEAGQNSLLTDLLTAGRRHNAVVDVAPAIIDNLLSEMEGAIAPATPAELTKSEEIHSLLVSCLKEQDRAARTSQSAEAYICACLRVGLPQRALVWVKRLHAPSQSVERLLESLKKDNLWTQHEEFLVQHGQRLLSSSELCKEWKAQAENTAQHNPAKAGKIYADNAISFVSEGDVETLLEEVSTLASRLKSSKKYDDKELALDLLVAYDIKTHDLWDSVLLSLTTGLPDPKRIAKAWNTFMGLNVQGITYNTRIQLLRGLINGNCGDPALMELMSEEVFTQSGFYGKTNKQRSEVRGHLFSNAMACILADVGPDVDFDELNEYRINHFPQMSEDVYVSVWLFSKGRKYNLEAIRHLKNAEKQGNTIEIPPSKELFQFIVNTIPGKFDTTEDGTLLIPDDGKYLRVTSLLDALHNDYSLHQYCLKMLRNPEYKVLIPEEELVKALLNIIPGALNGARNTRDPELAMAALDCFASYQDILTKQNKWISACYEQVLAGLPLLLLPDRTGRVPRTKFRELFTTIVTDIKLPPARTAPSRGRPAVPATPMWHYNNKLICSLLDTPISEPDFLFSILTILEKHMTVLIDTCKDQEVACLNTLEELIFSPLFSKQEGNELLVRLEMDHHDVLLRLVMKAQAKGLFRNNILAQAIAEIYFNCRFSEEIKLAEYNEYGEITVAVMKKLLEHRSYSNLRRAYLILGNTMQYTVATPLKTIPLIKSLTDETLLTAMPHRVRMELLTVLHSEIERFLNPKTTANITFKGVSAARTYWKEKTPSILGAYALGLNMAAKGLKIPSKGIYEKCCIEQYYNTANQVLNLLERHDVARTEEGLSAHFQTLDIALDFWKHSNHSEEVHQRIVSIFASAGKTPENDGKLTVTQAVQLERMFDQVFTQTEDTDTCNSICLIVDALDTLRAFNALKFTDHLYCDCYSRLQNLVQNACVDGVWSDKSLERLHSELAKARDSDEPRAEMRIFKGWTIWYRRSKHYAAITSTIVKAIQEVSAEATSTKEQLP